MRKFVSLFSCAVLALVLLACSTLAPISNYPQQPVPPGLTQQQVGKIIAVTATKIGWRVNMGNPGFMTASVDTRSHIAVVSITYSATSYSIAYKSSTNMQYDGSSSQIHRNYNRWVKRLNDNIQTNLHTQSFTKS